MKNHVSYAPAAWSPKEASMKSATNGQMRHSLKQRLTIDLTVDMMSSPENLSWPLLLMIGFESMQNMGTSKRATPVPQTQHKHASTIGDRVLSMEYRQPILLDSP